MTDDPRDEDVEREDAEPPPKYLFLDTQFFKQYDFDFANAKLKGLAKLGEAGRVRLVLPGIIEDEIRSHIAREAREAAAPPRPAAILRNSTLPQVPGRLAAIDAEALEREVVESFDGLLKACSVLRLDTDKILVSRVHKDYVAERPPFAGKSRKEQFADGFAVAALRDWWDREKESIAVITKDKQMNAACAVEGAFVAYDDLKGYLIAMTTAIVEDEDAAARRRIEESESFVIEWLSGELDEVRRRGEAAFIDRGFMIEDADGDVGDVEVVSIECEGKDEYEILAISEGYALVSVPAEVTFRAKFFYLDPSSGTYDSEDKVMMLQDRIETTREYVSAESFLVEVEFEGTAPDSFNVSNVQVQGDMMLSIYGGEGSQISSYP